MTLNPNTEILSRYRARIEEVEALRRDLQLQQRPAGPAAVVGLLLEAVGDLLRRSRQVPADPARLDAALAAVPREGLAAWHDGLSLEALEARVRRAADEAVEAAIPEGDEGGDTWATWALQGLMARDRLASCLTALGRLKALGREDAGAFHARLSAATAAMDTRLSTKVPYFTALNLRRRAEAQVLDDAAAAFWFTARSRPEDDGFIAALGAADPSGLSGVAREVSELVHAPRSRPVTFDELFRYDVGLATPAEVARIEAQAKTDPQVRQALLAMAEAEDAIEGPQQPDTPRRAAGPGGLDGGGSGARSGSAEVIEDRAEFKVLLFRRSANVHLVVAPRRADRFAAAAVYLAEAPERGRPYQATADGLDFALGAAAGLAGQSARVVVRLTDGREVTVRARL